MNTSLMNTNLLFFTYEDKKIRTVLIKDEPFWVSRDVCDLLCYKNASDAVNDHCKGVAKYYPLQTAGGTQELRIISEPDLLRLITSSTLPEAIKFESWIFEEVLPQIRRTGSYTATGSVRDINNRIETLENGLADISKQFKKELQALTSLVTINLPEDGLPGKHTVNALLIKKLVHQIRALEKIKSTATSGVRSTAADQRRVKLLCEYIFQQTGNKVSQHKLFHDALNDFVDKILGGSMPENYFVQNM